MQIRIYSSRNSEATNREGSPGREWRKRVGWSNEPEYQWSQQRHLTGGMSDKKLPRN
jgi:hypothetical protein